MLEDVNVGVLPNCLNDGYVGGASIISFLVARVWTI